MAELALGISLSTKYVLTGPDGTRAVFNEPSDPDFVGAITEVTGLDSPEIRESSENLSGLDGGVHGNFYLGRRPVTLSGTIYNVVSAEDRNKKITKIQQASAALREDATLEWTPAGGEAVYVKLRRQQPLRVSGAWAKEFQLLMVSADPRIYSVATQEAGTVFTEIGETFVGVLAEPYYLAISPDGKSVYVTEESGKKIFQFTRLTTGFLEAMVTPSVEGKVNSGRMVISPDGKWLFSIPNVTNISGGEGGKEINIFSRNTSTGSLTFSKTQVIISDAHDITMSPDGNYIYVACKEGKSIVEFSRSEGTLTKLGETGVAVEPEILRVTPDGKFLLVSYFGAVNIVTYSKAETGKIVATPVFTYKNAVSKLVTEMTISRDSKTVYLTYDEGKELAAISRNVETSAMVQLTPIYNMNKATTPTSSLVVSPDNKNVYSFNEKGIEQTVRSGEGALTALSPAAALWPSPNSTIRNAICSPDGKNVYMISRQVVFTMGRTNIGNLLYMTTNKVACLNKGSFEVFAVVTFKGALENPAVFDYTNGQAVIFEGILLEPSDILVVDMLNRTAILNGFTSKYGNVNFYGTEWFSLKPGETDLRASATSVGLTPNITVKWRNGWV